MKRNNLAGLGRLHIPDERDHAHLMPRRMALTARRSWWTPPAWDQGGTSMCVAYGTNRFLASSPIRNKPFDFNWLYKEAQKLDQWPGEHYEGTSVRAAMKVLKREGLISGYQWAFSAPAVIDHLLTVGPVVVGTNWSTEMFMPDRYGFISPGGADAGGHCYTLVGADRTKMCPDKTFGAVRLVNSWGPGWGDNGRAWMTMEVLDALIKADGEAAVATEVLK